MHHLRDHRARRDVGTRQILVIGCNRHEVLPETSAHVQGRQRRAILEGPTSGADLALHHQRAMGDKTIWWKKMAEDQLSRLATLRRPCIQAGCRSLTNYQPGRPLAINTTVASLIVRALPNHDFQLHRLPGNENMPKTVATTAMIGFHRLANHTAQTILLHRGPRQQALQVFVHRLRRWRLRLALQVRLHVRLTSHLLDHELEDLLEATSRVAEVSLGLEEVTSAQEEATSVLGEAISVEGATSVGEVTSVGEATSDLDEANLQLVAVEASEEAGVDSTVHLPSVVEEVVQASLTAAGHRLDPALVVARVMVAVRVLAAAKASAATRASTGRWTTATDHQQAQAAAMAHHQDLVAPSLALRPLSHSAKAATALQQPTHAPNASDQAANHCQTRARALAHQPARALPVQSASTPLSQTSRSRSKVAKKPTRSSTAPSSTSCRRRRRNCVSRLRRRRRRSGGV